MEEFNRQNLLGLLDKRPGPPKEAEAPEIGSIRTFIPMALTATNADTAIAGYGIIATAVRVTAECVYVNHKNRYARYRYITPRGEEAFECFKF